MFQVLRQLIINKIIVTNVVLETGGAHEFVEGHTRGKTGTFRTVRI